MKTMGSAGLGLAGSAVLLAAALALSALPVSASDTPTDEARVVEAVQAMFAALADDDLARFRQVTTPDFYAFDMGKDMSSEQLVEVVEQGREAGMEFTWRVTEPKVHIDGQTAWVTYVNRGSVRRGDKQRDVVWLESAVLGRAAGAWRVRFLHSTPVPGDHNGPGQDTRPRR